MKIALIVTRHPSLVAYLIEQGLATAETRVLEHASAADIRGRHVLGILPHHLSSLAASITEIPMRTTPADREAMQRGDLTLDDVRRVAGKPVTYVVLQQPIGGIDTGALAAYAAVTHCNSDRSGRVVVEGSGGTERAEADVQLGRVRFGEGPRANWGPWRDPSLALALPSGDPGSVLLLDL